MKRTFLLSVTGLLSSCLLTLAAEPLVSISAVVKDPVPESREMTFGEGESSSVLHVRKSALVSTEDIASLKLHKAEPSVLMELSDDGARKFAAATATMKGERLAIIVKGKILSAPMIMNAPLGRSVMLTGFKDLAEVEALVEEFAKTRE